MRRFFKSAAFPILLVVILAFVAQKVITNNPGHEAPPYNELTETKTGLIEAGKIEIDYHSLDQLDSILDKLLRH